MLTKQKVELLSDWISVIRDAAQEKEHYKKADPYMDCVTAGMVVERLEPNDKLFSLPRREQLHVLNKMSDQYRQKICALIDEENMI